MSAPEPFQVELLEWYDAHKRDLPWRQTSDPYAVWVSEIMLQQTQVATVIPYWLRWLERFPTIESLASASEQELLSFWQGLGYYRRCRLLQKGAQYVSANGLPGSAEEWERVPGVGAYTAGAIASIAQSRPAALVDGNVERVYSRLTGDKALPAELKKRAWEWARISVAQARPGDWNQALMELGATVCTPAQPLCHKCPLQARCVAYALGNPSTFPTRVSKPKPIALKHLVWVPVFEGRVGLRQIPSGSWWEGMWEFPRVDVTRQPIVDGESSLRALVGAGWSQYLGAVKHSVTNHRISIEAHLVRCESQSSDLAWHTAGQLADIPMPAPQRKVMRLALAHIQV